MLVVVLAGALASSATAATINVTTRTDGVTADSACSLREAVAAANTDSAGLGCPAGSGSDTIALGSGNYPLTIAPTDVSFDNGSGSLDVNEDSGDLLTITSAQGATIDASAISDRALTVQTSLVLANLTIEGGDGSSSVDAPGEGGAVASFGGAALVLSRVVLAGNTATLGGGAIASAGPLQVDTSTLSGNSVTAPAAGSGGGAIDAADQTNVRRSTIAGNSVATGDGTGVGGAIRYGGPLTLTGSILADDAADSGSECAAAGGSATSGGFNVIEDGSGCGAPASTDRQADPGLRPLADNGGPTQTRSVPAGSAAINIGPSACSGTTDQRGAPRGVAETGSCDAGAYEAAFCGPQEANVWGTLSADVITSTRPHVYAIGLAGPDTMAGGNGSDALCGGLGTDLLSGGGGADLLIGGADVDVATYQAVSQPLTIKLDNLANDGRAGEGDNVQTESVIGGSAADRITGSAAANGLLGKGGNDVIDGGDGNDSVVGGDGNDTVSGGAGNDQVRGDAGNDILSGGDGKDRIEGNAGKNKLDGGDGNDTLIGGSGKDTFKCGDGKDTVVASKKDKVARDCETVTGKKGHKHKGHKKGKHKGHKKGKHRRR